MNGLGVARDPLLVHRIGPAQACLVSGPKLLDLVSKVAGLVVLSLLLVGSQSVDILPSTAVATPGYSSLRWCWWRRWIVVILGRLGR